MARSVIVFVLAFFCTISLSFAQKGSDLPEVLSTAICTPDCPNDKFENNPMQTVPFTLGACKYEVDFYWRKACSTYCDLLIWRVRCIDDSPACRTISLSDLLNIATAKAIEHARANLPDMDCGPSDIGQCTTYWRVSKAACWHWFENSGFNPSLPSSSGNYWGGISYCDVQVCCFTRYRVCMDQFGQIVVTEVQKTSTGPCPYDPNPHYPCTSACGD